NLICSLDVPLTGRITAVTEIARAGGSSAVTHMNLVSCERGGSALTEAAAITPIASVQKAVTAIRFIPFEHSCPPEVSRVCGGSQVIWYSGPSPPSGGVRRPPFAVIAPHCKQLV